jgi:hypothetical protein
VTRRGGHREKNVDDIVNSFERTAVIRAFTLQQCNRVQCLLLVYINENKEIDTSIFQGRE